MLAEAGGQFLGAGVELLIGSAESRLRAATTTLAVRRREMTSAPSLVTGRSARRLPDQHVHPINMSRSRLLGDASNGRGVILARHEMDLYAAGTRRCGGRIGATSTS